MRQRRQFAAQFKAQVVLEVLTGQKRTTEVCRQYQLKPDLLSRWKVEFVRQAPVLFQGDERLLQADQRIADLARMVGRLPIELAVAKKAALLSTGNRNGR